MNSSQNKQHETYQYQTMIHKQKLFQEFRKKMFEHFKDKQLVIFPTNFQKINPNDRRTTADFFLSLAHGFSSLTSHKSELSIHVHRSKRREGIQQRDQTLVESGSNTGELPSNQCDGSMAAFYPVFSDVSQITETPLYPDLEPRRTCDPD